MNKLYKRYAHLLGGDSYNHNIVVAILAIEFKLSEKDVEATIKKVTET